MKKKFSIVLIGVLLLIAGSTHAQKETAADTAQYIDSAVAPPVLEDSPGDNDDAKALAQPKPNDYFLLKTSLNNETSDSLELRRVKDSLRSALVSDKDFWYANTVFPKTPEKKSNDAGAPLFSRQRWLETFLWVLIIGGFLAFLIIYLSNSNVRLFRKNRTIPTEEADVETDDIFAINYQKEIDKAVATGNYRLAVRLLFLRLLRNLSTKNAIQYAQGKTNFDYLVQVSQAPWYKQFFRLTRHYEYVWYGLFELDSDKFATIKNDFNDFERQF